MYTQRTKCTVRISKLVLYSVTDLHNDANFSLIRLGSILASIERTRLLAQSITYRCVRSFVRNRLALNTSGEFGWKPQNRIAKKRKRNAIKLIWNEFEAKSMHVCYARLLIAHGIFVWHVTENNRKLSSRIELHVYIHAIIIYFIANYWYN